jgi:tetratricopeptide (TPR) repeat protein
MSPSELVLAKLGIEPAAIKSIKPRWKRTHYRAVINWLTKYSLEPEEANIRTGRGCLEAFYHLYQVEDWERARKIIETRLNTPSNEKSLIQLRPWGYYKFEQYSEALEYLQTALQICRKAGDHHAEALTLYDLAIFHLLGLRKTALAYCNQALLLAKNLKLPIIKNCQNLKSLLLSEEAEVFISSGKYLQAVECYQEKLALAQELRDYREQENTLINLGKLYCALTQYDKTLKYNQYHLAIVQFNLARIYQNSGHYFRAIEHCNYALSIATYFNIPLVQDCQAFKEELLSQEDE